VYYSLLCFSNLVKYLWVWIKWSKERLQTWIGWSVAKNIAPVKNTLDYFIAVFITFPKSTKRFVTIILYFIFPLSLNIWKQGRDGANIIICLAQYLLLKILQWYTDSNLSSWNAEAKKIYGYLWNCNQDSLLQDNVELRE